MNNNFIKILIVDDEENTRNLIKKCINWDELGIYIAGEASSGQEALDMLESFNSDIIITDIRMQFMDGLELSKKVAERYPHIKIIVLTAYEEFEYAQQGIKIGIDDYLLKPIKRSELRKSVESLKNKIETERMSQAEYIKLKERPAENFSYLNEETNKSDFYIKGDRSKKVNKVCIEIVEYIQKNIADPELSLSSIANKFYLNPSYLCRVFKQEIGQSFIEYLTKIRIEKAIELLRETDLRNYEVCEKIGVLDPNYFGKCFKKYTGISVSDFKKTQMI